MINFILTVIVIAMIVGLLLWAVNSLPFIPAPMAQIIRVFIIVVACLWLISVLFGHIGGLGFGHSIKIN